MNLLATLTLLPLFAVSAGVASPPAITKLEPPEKDFFAKQLMFRGLPIKASVAASNEALYAAYERLDGMLRKLLEVVTKLVAAGVELHIIGRDQVTSDLPEWRHDKGKPLAEYKGLTRDQRTRGMGGKLVSCGEENLLRLEKDRYRGRDICLHEFAHAVRTYGQSRKIHAQFDEQLKRSLAAGRWRGAYAGSNPDEFFAELTMWYFGTHGDLAMTGAKPANGPEGLKQYDPEAFALFDAFYSGRLYAQVALNSRHSFWLRNNMKRQMTWLLALLSVARKMAAVTFAADAQAQELDLGARVQPVPLEAKFSVPGYYVWCGAPAQGADGKYHLFYSRWPVTNPNGFAPGWAICSEIAYAVADKPFGPYKHVNVALPARGINPATGKKFWDADMTHNPNIVVRGGKFLLYYIGNHGDGKYATHRNLDRIGVAIADKPEGPWTRLDAPIIDVSPDPTAFDSLCVANPGAAVRPDGGLLVVFKAVEQVPGKLMGGKVRYGVAVADKPEGPYKKLPGRVFEAEGVEAAKHWMLAEDPYIWFSKKYGNRYYAVARDVVGKFTGSSGGLALFQSDDGLHWKAAAQPKVLANRFTWADGTPSLANVERPALLFEGEEPIALFGATDGYKKNGRISCNVQIPLKPAP